MTTHDTDDKYIVFKRDDFFHQMQGLPAAVWANIAIPDAVVIRRQDLIASPALATYAAMVAIAAKLTDDKEKKGSLLRISDYFETQAQMAADEGWKFPDV